MKKDLNVENERDDNKVNLNNEENEEEISELKLSEIQEIENQDKKALVMKRKKSKKI